MMVFAAVCIVQMGMLYVQCKEQEYKEVSTTMIHFETI